MTDNMNQDDLHSLWTSQEETVDMDMILDTRDRLERGRIVGRRIMDGFHLAMALMVLLYGVLEFSGVFNTGGWLTGGFFIYFCFMVALTARRRRKNPEIASLSPQGLLENAISRAKNNLRMARVLYAALPISELIGGGFGYVIAGSIVDHDRADMVSMVWPAGLILIICVATFASTVYGVRLAQKKQVELKELRARLAIFEAEV